MELGGTWLYWRRGATNLVAADSVAASANDDRQDESKMTIGSGCAMSVRQFAFAMCV